jgi:hypothetical protein
MGIYFSSISTKESESIKVITDIEHHNVIVTTSEIKNETNQNVVETNQNVVETNQNVVETNQNVVETNQNVSSNETFLNKQLFNHDNNIIIYKKQLKKKKCKKIKKKHLQ